MEDKSLLTKNPFEGVSVQAQCARIFYDLLLHHKKISIADIQCCYSGKNEVIKKSQDPNYKKQIRAISDVIKAITRKGGTVEKIQEGRDIYYLYTGEDVLAEEKSIVEKKKMRDFIGFVKAVYGMLPLPMVTHFFDNTSLFLDLKRRKEEGCCIIYANGNSKLKNIDLIPDLYEAITQKTVLKFRYHPFGKQPYFCTIHPHVLKEYNDRWFLFGLTKNKRTREFMLTNIAIDRIEPPLIPLDEDLYQSYLNGLYDNFFKNRVGVSGQITDVPIHIILRTYDSYTYGRLITKPIHDTQHIRVEYSEEIGYGEISIDAVSNKELQGVILGYGDKLEVMSPIDYRNVIANEIKKGLSRYESH